MSPGTVAEEVARRAPHDLIVIPERDGAYPEMAPRLAQLERARTAGTPVPFAGGLAKLL
jgi:predicted transcriptional regulator